MTHRDEAKRWCEDGASPLVQRMLESAEDDVATAEDLRALAVTLGPALLAAGVTAGVGAAAGTSSVGTLAGLSLKVKLGLAVVAVGVGVGVPVVYQANRPAPLQQEKKVSRSAIAHPRKEPLDPMAEAAPLEVVPPETTATLVAKPRVVARPKEQKPPLNEVELLLKAQKQNESSDFAEALRTLELAESKYPAGPLAQERSVLLIEALVGAGRLDEAKARGVDFDSRWPTSAHRLRIRALISQ